MDEMKKYSLLKILNVSIIILSVILFSSPNLVKAEATKQETSYNLYLPFIEGKLIQSPFGVSMDYIIPAQGLVQLTTAATSWTRRGFTWSAIEPSPGSRNWDANIEQELINASQSYIQTMMIIEGTPSWALKTKYTCGAVAQDKFAELGQFVYDLVKRYSQAPYNVRYWELWNEPDAAGTLGCWGDPGDKQYYGGAYYGEMLKVVYPVIKQADPQAQVLVGGLLLDCDPDNPPAGKACTPARFLNGILAVGGGPYFDGVSFHAYDYYTDGGGYANPNWHSSSSTTGPVSIAKARYLKGVLAQYGVEGKYLLNTETAVFYGPNVMDPPCAEGDPAKLEAIEATKVGYLIQSYAVAVAEGWSANIWYSAFGVRCSGLFNQDLSPKAAYYAYQFARQKLGGAVFEGPVSGYDNVMGYQYGLPGEKLWVVWSLGGQAPVITLPALPIAVNRVGQDGYPAQEKPSSTLEVNLSPLFIEFAQ